MKHDMNSDESALAGARVIDLTHMVAGPLCTKCLAEYGAEVIKIERPGSGDPARSMGPFLNDTPGTDTSGLFSYLNTGKKSVTLNLKDPAGVQLLHELIRNADVLVENFEPRVMPSLGLSYEAVKEVNPRLVMTSLSNYGQSGQYTNYKGYPLNLLAMGGVMNLTGDPRREPLAMGGMQAEFVGASYAFLSTLMAVYLQRAANIGQHVDVSIMESLAANLERTTIAYSFLGVVSHRGTGRFFNGYPWGIFPCKDGHLFIIPGAGNLPNLALMVENPGLAEDPLFTDRDRRLEHPEEFDPLILPWLMEHTRDEIVELAAELRMPFAAVVTVDELMRSPQLKERDYFVEVDHPSGRFRYPGPQFKMSETPAKAVRAPMLGEHNVPIYSGMLGHSGDDLVRMREQGVI